MLSYGCVSVSGAGKFHPPAGVKKFANTANRVENFSEVILEEH
jgi:hypothetical protein